MPERSNGYQVPSYPKTLIDRILWNFTMGDVDERLRVVEARAASFTELEERGIQASLDYIQVNVAPQIATLQTKITLAQEQIDQIIVGGKAPDTLKFGGQLPAYYATTEGLESLQASLSEYMRNDLLNQPEGVAPLGVDGKVPLANLPALTTTATVGAAIAGANGLATPDDGDALAGVKSGTSTMFRWTWGNIKAALTALFDGRYLRLVGGILSGGLTIQPAAGAAVFKLRAVANEGCVIDFSPNGYGGEYNWRVNAHTDNVSFDVIHNGTHRFRIRNDGEMWTSAYGWLSVRFADRGARVQREGGVWEFGSIDPNYNARTTDAPAPYVLVGLRSSNGTNVINLRAELLRNN
ncbi:hypothetical protein ATN81_28115 [Agrobacterium pusense]|uniref:hypothetical protein n=1 Tax=Agrobacterium pusense TaxID=648995 RepID=UPI00092CE1B3|nr:hypothetical protein [Agrobacterium pusense]MDP9772615.1 hypothetical protein [Rhizobium sp. SORGH_AS_0755]OJH51626.1 hypothetical protein ATN81_28115 [Agrobacterium pusense]